MKPGGGRTKGHSWEREVANLLKPYFPQAKRGLQYQIDFDGSDVIGTPFWIECKRGRKVSIRKALEQTARDNKTDKPVLVISKEDNCRPLVTMEFDVFEKLLQAVQATVPVLIGNKDNG